MKKTFILFASLLTILSCQDFLVEESKSEMTQEYYNTEQGLYEGVASIYSSCREIFKANMFLVNMFSDIAENGASRNDSYDNCASPNSGLLNDLFCDLQQGIMLANRMERAVGEPDTRTKEIYLGEICAARAMFYQYCVELWGRYGHFQDKIWDEFDEDMLYMHQVSVKDYYEQILKDINFAIEKLPSQAQISEFGRFSQGAAKALKARFLLAIAGYSDPMYSGEEEHDLYRKVGYSSLSALYSEAKGLAGSVIDDYNYKLCKNYGDVFDEDNQKNDEIIWSVQWTQDKTFNTDAANVHRYGIGKSGQTLIQSFTNGKTTVTAKQVQVTRKDGNGKDYTYKALDHSMWYGREYRHIMPSFKWIMMFDNKDKRKYETFETVYLRLSDGLLAPPDLTDTICYMPFRIVSPEEDDQYVKWVNSKDPHAYYIDGLNEVYDLDDPDPQYYGGPLPHRSRYYSLKKFYDRSRNELAKQEDGTGNVTVIRLAEMYIIKAECAYRLGEGDDAVYNCLEPLWSRAFDNIKDASVYKPADGVDIDFIIDEYDREVGFEFNTWFILKRTHRMIDRVSAMPKSRQEAEKTRFCDLARQYGNYLYLKPFPQKQAERVLGMKRDMLPPGFDYGNMFD